MAERRFHRTDRWNRKFAQIPEEIKPTISSALAMLAEGHTKAGPEETIDEDVPTAGSILRFTDLMGFGRVGEQVAALGNVLIRFLSPADHPVIILDDLIWLD